MKMHLSAFKVVRLSFLRMLIDLIITYLDGR